VKPSAEKPVRKLLRCAVYTRKSTEYNLDLEFNSLDAQREACEAYIKSQAHEGWRLIPDHYDDGAFSGASLDRPALQVLLAEVKLGKIDVIVVYKVDRLTRSLADFAKLVELFDQHTVSFVSVTQSFNTTSSMGRLTLNVLLSFAQFEREVIGERVRDKIAASKAKGIWVGGPVPIGYASIKKKLVVVLEDAETVRLIFQRYLEVGSIRDLAEDLDRRKIRTRRQALSNGKIRGGIRFGVGSLAQLLRNRFFIGEIAYRGAQYVGEHEAIVDRPLFEAVQAKLAASATARRNKSKASTSILAGRIFDEHGNRMTPTHTNKQGARYRYYVSHSSLQQEDRNAMRISAPEVEAMALQAIQNALAGQESVDTGTPRSERSLVEQHLEKIVVRRQSIEFSMNDGAQSAHEYSNPPRSAPDGPANAGAVHRIVVPRTIPATVTMKGIIHSPSPKHAADRCNRDALLTAIAKARVWISDLAAGRVGSIGEIANREGKVERHIRLLAPLAFVSPKLIANIASGDAPPPRITDFARRVAYSWKQQVTGSEDN
jgi:site-specific DNA recombinase